MEIEGWKVMEVEGLGVLQSKGPEVLGSEGPIVVQDNVEGMRDGDKVGCKSTSKPCSYADTIYRLHSMSAKKHHQI